SCHGIEVALYSIRRVDLDAVLGHPHSLHHRLSSGGFEQGDDAEALASGADKIERSRTSGARDARTKGPDQLALESEMRGERGPAAAAGVEYDRLGGRRNKPLHLTHELIRELRGRPVAGRLHLDLTAQVQWYLDKASRRPGELTHGG